MNDNWQKYLEENYSLIGANERVLEDRLNELSDNTVITSVGYSQIIIYSIVHIARDGLYVLVIRPECMDVESVFPLQSEKSYFSKENGNYIFISYRHLKKGLGLTQELIDEIRDRGYFMRYQDTMGKSIYLIPGKLFFASLCRQLDCPKLPDIEDPFLYIFVAYLMNDHDSFKLMYRKGDSVGKAFSCFSEGYVDIKQIDAYKQFVSVIKKKIEGKISFFRITHFVTTIRYEIPSLSIMLGKRKLSSCILFSLSDTGDRSITIESCISVNGRDIRVGRSICQPHKGDIDITRMTKKYLTEGYKDLCGMIDLLGNIRKEQVVKADMVLELLQICGFKNAAGSKVAKLYEERLKEMEGKTVDLSECVVELLSLPGMLEDFYRKASLEAVIKRNNERKRGERSGHYEYEEEKSIPPSVLEKVEQAIGSLFSNKKVRKILYDNK